MKLTLIAIANSVNHTSQKLVPPVLSIINQVTLVQEMLIQLRIQRVNLRLCLVLTSHNSYINYYNLINHSYKPYLITHFSQLIPPPVWHPKSLLVFSLKKATMVEPTSKNVVVALLLKIIGGGQWYRGGGRWWSSGGVEDIFDLEI